MIINKIKKISLLFLCISILAFGLYATGNSRILPLEDELYSMIDDLYMLEGRTPQHGARPWTIAEALYYAEKITPTAPAAAAIRQEIIDELSASYGDASFGLMVNPVAAFHTNTEFSRAKEWNVNSLDEHLIGVSGLLSWKDLITAEAQLSIGFTPAGGTDGKTASASDPRYVKSFSSNIPFVSEGALDLTMVRRSYMAVGGKGFLFSVGRDRQTWGNGLMGNLILSPTLPYHDYARVRLSSDIMSFDSLALFFTHTDNYGNNQNDTFSGIRMFIGHRLEFRVFDEKLRLTLNESIMYQSNDGYFDYRVLNPLLIMHGFYINNYANSLASLELEYAPVKGLQVYGSFAVDDLSVGGESRFPEPYATPDSWGVMGGIRTGWMISERDIFRAVAEGVYVSPFTYHRRTGEAVYSVNDHALDYVGTVSYFENNSIRVQNAYLSFPFGSDALALKLQGEYSRRNVFDISVHTMFMLHGVTDEYSVIHLSDRELKPLDWLTVESPFEELAGELSWTFNIGAEGQYHVSKNVMLTASIEGVYVRNFRHEKGRSEFDMQLSAGAKVTL